MDNTYPLHQGYLVKSPPDTRYTGRIKSWRKRWFKLWENKILEYYEEKGGRLKNSIDLNLCTCVESNLYHKKFPNTFSITIKGKQDGKFLDRTYYLVAESSYEMKSWIDQICKICDFQKTDGYTRGPMDANRSTNVSETAASAHYDGHCPLRNLEKVKSNSTSDSGMRVLINENNNTSDLAPVSPPSTTTCRSAYDVVPPPRPAIGYFEQGSKLSSEDVEPEYDVPPQNAQESYDIVPPLRSQLRNSCPLDKSSSSDDSAIADLKTSECESSDYDVPPANQDYDVPPHVSRLEQNYGFSPTSQPAYDIVPPPVGVYNPHQPYSNIDPRPSSGIYDHVPPQVPSKPAHYQSPKPSGPNYDTVPPPSGKLPSENYSEETYDHVPPPVQAPSSTHSSSSGIYDVVPARHNDPVSDYHTEHNAVASPPMSQAPDASGKAYVNLTFPVKDFNSYKKPLPIPPGTMNSERYSGTVISFESHDDVYDVPPKCSTIPSSNQWQQGWLAPKVNRFSKPSVPKVDHSPAPIVDRSSKPESAKSSNYVNLPRSATLREFDRETSKTNLQRSKSSAGDGQLDTYLYMESPKRTESSIRFRKKNTSLDASEEQDDDDDDDVSYEYMDLRGSCGSASYENFNREDLNQSIQKPELSPDNRLKGHYQDIDVVCQRGGVSPVVPERQRNPNYTTIDLEKTQGLRKTRADLGKGQ